MKTSLKTSTHFQRLLQGVRQWKFVRVIVNLRRAGKKSEIKCPTEFLGLFYHRALPFGTFCRLVED